MPHDDPEVESLKTNMRELDRRLRDVEDLWDTFAHSPLWKRLLFAIDGWPTRRLDAAPQWRPWRRWWTA